MREYLQATGLQLRYEDDPTRDRQLAALETECQVVGALIDPAALAGASRNLDALEARAVADRNGAPWADCRRRAPVH